MQISSNYTDSQGFGALHSLWAGETSSSFAALIMSRTAPAQAEGADGARETGRISSSGAENQGLGQKGSDRNSPSPETAAKLESALAGSIDYLAAKFGEGAAAAAMGVILKRVGSGPVDERSLGDGFLSAIKFVDRQFGVEEGDQFIKELNGSLNDGINAFFDNGLNEKFIASTTPAGGSAMNGPNPASAALQDGATRSIASELKNMLESLQKNRPGEDRTQPDDLRAQHGKRASPYFEAPILEPGLVVDVMA